jgi:hypothetical protein
MSLLDINSNNTSNQKFAENPLIDIDKKTGDVLEKQPSNKERDKNYVKTSPNLQHIENLYFDGQVSKV